MGENSNIEWTDHIDSSATGRKLGAYKTAAGRTGCSVEEWMRRRSIGQKWCFDCQSWKDAGSFTIDKSRVGGLTSRCRPCIAVASRASTYKMTRGEMKTMLAAAADGCPICLRPMDKPVIDHCHDTDRVRGLICDTCNRGLGMFGDDPDRIRRALSHLEQWESDGQN